MEVQCACGAVGQLKNIPYVIEPPDGWELAIRDGHGLAMCPRCVRKAERERRLADAIYAAIVGNGWMKGESFAAISAYAEDKAGIRIEQSKE